VEYAVLIFSGGVLAIGVFLGKLMFVSKGKNTKDALDALEKESGISRDTWKDINQKDTNEHA
jgi:hypothetical protein